ncbi:Chitinase 2 [Marasmius tenuissimus]|uniref:Chitinase 2 n=1 Tax=Marasmius tenuissimus TaxID=585030 RepID=A0ABR2ZU37_9AGAR
MPFFYFTLFSFVVVAQALVARGPTCTQQYTVQSGDSCNAIENYFKLAPGTVRSLNSLVNAQCTNLYPGQSLCLSTSSSNPSGGGGASCSQSYTVQSGDSCSKIENRFGLNAGSVVQSNPSVNAQCTNLYPGQVLCLVAGSGGGDSTVTVTGPTTTALATTTQTYTLSETQTLSTTATAIGHRQYHGHADVHRHDYPVLYYDITSHYNDDAEHDSHRHQHYNFTS